MIYKQSRISISWQSTDEDKFDKITGQNKKYVSCTLQMFTSQWRPQYTWELSKLLFLVVQLSVVIDTAVSSTATDIRYYNWCTADNVNMNKVVTCICSADKKAIQKVIKMMQSYSKLDI